MDSTSLEIIVAVIGAIALVIAGFLQSPLLKKRRSKPTPTQAVSTNVEIMNPQDDQSIKVRKDLNCADVYLFNVGGISTGVVGNSKYKIYVFVHHKEPSQTGFWIQKHTLSTDRDGGWNTTANVGSKAFPMRAGYRLELIALATETDLGHTDYVNRIEDIHFVARSKTIEVVIQELLP